MAHLSIGRHFVQYVSLTFMTNCRKYIYKRGEKLITLRNIIIDVYFRKN